MPMTTDDYMQQKLHLHDVHSRLSDYDPYFRDVDLQTLKRPRTRYNIDAWRRLVGVDFGKPFDGTEGNIAASTHERTRPDHMNRPVQQGMQQSVGNGILPQETRSNRVQGLEAINQQLLLAAKEKQDSEVQKIPNPFP